MAALIEPRSPDHPVLLLTQDEWAALVGVIRGHEATDSAARYALHAAGILEVGAVADWARPTLGELAAAERQFQAVLLALGGLRHVEAWIGPHGAALARHRHDGVHVYALDEEELPSTW